jgi:Tol biopolymer transport system component
MNRVGHYELRGLLGKGGMGEVYRALDTKLGREVALKILPEAFAHDANRMARFEREAQVLASLNHPNIAAIYGLEESDGTRALVMELVEGPTLAERIGGRVMSLEEALPIAKQIAEALEYAHEKGIIHRDLKPANVKLTADGHVKLLDFGLAKALEAPAQAAGNPSISPTLTVEGTRAGVILGTAAYMAPEQARGAIVDKRADIWSFGVVLYERLTGQQPFAGATVSDTLAAVLKTEPDITQSPAQAQRLLRRCLEKDPKRRLRDIGDALPLIEGATETVPAPRSSQPWKIAAGALAVIAAIALALLWRATRPINQPLVRLSLELPEFALTPEGAQPGVGLILSPDGRRIVYTGRGPDGTFRLYTRTLDQEQSTTLAGTEGAYGPFFSPDGQAVGFFAGGKLKKTSVERGGVVVLCDASGGVGGSWGDDNNIIAALNSGAGTLSRIPSGGGKVQPVTDLKPEGKEIGHTLPQVLPGAQAVLFTALPSTSTFEEATIEAQSLLTGEKKTLVHRGSYGRYVPSGHLLYVHHGTLYAAPMDLNRLQLTGSATPVVEEGLSSSTWGFAQADFSRSGTLVYVRGKAAEKTLQWLDATGQTQPLRATAADYYESVRFSPDGKQLAVGLMEDGNANIWLYEWERDRMIHRTFTAGFDNFPVWSPDGKHIVFGSTRHGGTENLYWMRADGAGETVRLTESKHVQVAGSFSPDGKLLAFNEVDPKTGGDLWTLPLEKVDSDHPKPGKPEPLLVTPFNEWVPMISPDGRWLAYVSNESGHYEVYVRPFPRPGGKWQISTGGGRGPVWSRKRPELFYQSSEGIMVASYTANSAAFVYDKPRLWARKHNLEFFDLASDGKRFAVVETEAPEQKGPRQVTVLQNFFDELRRRAPAGGK